MNRFLQLSAILLIAAIPLVTVAPLAFADAEIITFQDGVDDYAGTRDTYIYDVSPDTPRGSETTMVQDKNTGDERRSLLLFDLSAIPGRAVILSAELQFYVDTEGQGFNMYRMLEPWDEATVTFNSIGGRHFAPDDNDAESSVNANWPGDDGYTGFIFVPVPAATVQDWIDGTLPNNGWLMIATHADDGQQLRTRESATPADRPKLVVEYLSPSSDPTIALTGIPLSEFNSQPGTPSPEQSYTVSGINLTADIHITAPSDFEISTNSGSGFGSSLTLSQSGGSVAVTTIFVRFNRAAEGTSSGDITHTSAGATTQDAAVSGEAAAAPTIVIFQDGLDGYTGTRDTYIYDVNPGTVRGSETTMVQDKNTSDDRTSLLLFDLSSIPAGAVILSSELQFYVSAEGRGFNMYRMLVPWDESTVTFNSIGGRHFAPDDNDAESSVNANWPGDDGYTGFIFVPVPAATVQDWIDGTLPNNGWLMIATHADDGQQLRTREYATPADRPLFKVTYSTGGPANHAPEQPVLVSPSDGATEAFNPPILEVTVTDPDDDPLDVTFYGREAGSAGAGAEFTLIALPDTQNESQYNPAVFTSQTQWIADNETTENIVFVTHLGDLVNTANDESQWTNADWAMDLLDPAGIPYSVGPGNHDLPLYASPSLYPTYFGASRFAGKSWYGGSYSNDNYNNYSLFSASGMDLILINLQYNPTAAMLDWADNLLKTNPDRRAIVVSHSILNTNDTFTSEGTAIFSALKDNANLFLILCGHMHSMNDGAAYRAETGDDGHTIHIMHADYQDFANGGNGYLRILRFSPADNKIYATTYSPYIDSFITTSPDQMEMEYDMSENFRKIGENASVASSSNTFISWPWLKPSTTYEWYVAIDDGTGTATGTVWSFTTHNFAGDFNGDCDVDGLDLAAWVDDMLSGYETLDLATFALFFGQTDCP